MLIQTIRHTADDLALWNSYELGDIAHAATIAAKVGKAVGVIKAFAESPAYVGVSWGKDSVAALHLVLSAGVRLPVVWMRIEPIANPDCVLVRDAFLRSYDIDYYEIERHCTRDASGWHASGTLESAAKEAAKRFGGRRILGIRGDESTTRLLTCFRNGEASKNSCRPLAWWNVADVMGYLAANDLPVHPAYGMLGGGRYERNWLRVASIGGQKGRGRDRGAWETEYYGDVLRRVFAGK